MKKNSPKYYLDARLTTKVRVIPSKKTFEQFGLREGAKKIIHEV